MGYSGQVERRRRCLMLLEQALLASWRAILLCDGRHSLAISGTFRLPAAAEL